MEYYKHKELEYEKKFNDLQEWIIQEQKDFIDKHVPEEMVKESLARSKELLRRLDENTK